MPDGIPERLDRLSRQRPAARVGDRARHHQGDVESALVEQATQGKQRGFAVQRIEDRLDHEQVRPAFEKALGLRTVSGSQLRERGGPIPGVVHVGRERRRAVRGAEHTHDEARPLRSLRCLFVGRLTGEARRGHVELVHQAFGPVVALRDHLGVERVRLQQVGAGLEVGAVDLGNDVGTGKRQEVVVAAQIFGVRAQPLTAEILLVQGIGLDHRPHGTVEDEDALRKRGVELSEAMLSIGHRQKKCPRRQYGHRGSGFLATCLTWLQ